MPFQLVVQLVRFVINQLRAVHPMEAQVVMVHPHLVQVQEHVLVMVELIIYRDSPDIKTQENYL